MSRLKSLLYLWNNGHNSAMYIWVTKSPLRRGYWKFVITFKFLLLMTYHISMAQWSGFKNVTQYHCTQNYYILVKDINNDHYPDIITANSFTRNSSSFGISINDGTGHFHNQIAIPIRTGYTVWDFADLDTDGITDMLTSYYWDNGIRIYKGISSESFTEGPLVPTATHGWLSKISDMMVVWDVYGRMKYELINEKTEGQIYRTSWFSDASPGVYFLSTTVDEKPIIVKLIKY